MSEFSLFEQRMQEAAQPPRVIQQFRKAYERFRSQNDSHIREHRVEAVATLPHAKELESYATKGQRALKHLSMIKLNGGLGTSMGMPFAKFLLPVRGPKCFLDLVAKQVLSQRKRYGIPLPLITMDSFSTHEDTQKALSHYPALSSSIPSFFLQHQYPKIDARTFAPTEHPETALNWAPPGHGDLLLALKTSGMLKTLLDHEIHYIFVSNVDNLGATPDPRILGWMVEQQAPMVMECAKRGPADKKGGHLYKEKGQLRLRESAQCHPEDEAFFQDIEKHCFFNTNNLWFDLRALDQALNENPSGLALPLIVNPKSLDPRQADDPLQNPPVVQLETALGSALGLFQNARAIEVERSRFFPVKTTNDLLLASSDFFQESAEGGLVPERSHRPLIDLDPDYFRLIRDFQHRIPMESPPSLKDAHSLKVRGNIFFGEGVEVRGHVVLVHEGMAPLHLKNMALEGHLHF